MSDAIICLDTNVFIKALVEEEPAMSRAARELLETAIDNSDRLVAPAWAWAEVGSTLLKKVRTQELIPEDLSVLWAKFRRLPVEFFDSPQLRERAMELAWYYALPTLYDAGFLACTELVPSEYRVPRAFWTADERLLRDLGAGRPPWVHRLGE